MYMPGQAQAINITLKKGYVRTKNLPVFYDWLNSTRINQIEKKDIKVRLTDEEGNAQSGPFVALALFMRDTPELDRNVTVGEGQIIYQGDFRLRVTDVQVDDQFVVIKVATKRDSSQ